MNPNINGPELPIRFGGVGLGEKRHICVFFRTPEEEYELLLPFIAEGLDGGEKAFHVVNPILRADHLRRLGSVGVDVERQEVLGAAGQKGYTRTRLIAHVEWALEDREAVSDLVEYEARFNLIHDARDPVVCIYDLTKFKGDIIVDVLRTHPTIIVRGTLRENPFFVPPNQLLREMRERRAEPERYRLHVN